MTETPEQQGTSTAPVEPLPEPEIHPSSPPDGPQTVPAPPEPQPGPDGPASTDGQAGRLNEELQEENAATSLDQPSDASGNE
jgi:hypothetical protein